MTRLALLLCLTGCAQLDPPAQESSRAPLRLADLVAPRLAPLRLVQAPRITRLTFPPIDCAACDACGASAEACADACRALDAALTPRHAFDWWRCAERSACDLEHQRDCLTGLDCDLGEMVGEHCDTLARCASDGRGWLDEAACRADPYAEPQRWACLQPERRAAVTTCLARQDCFDMEGCIAMAACEGDPGCTALMSTRLAVDCHRICDAGHRGYDGDYARCYSLCDQAAMRLDDAHRRSFEACALEGRRERVIETCVSELACDAQRFADARGAFEARCGPDPHVTEPLEGLACLGEVLRAAVDACLEEAPCDALPSCIAAATCGDHAHCLDFLQRP